MHTFHVMYKMPLLSPAELLSWAPDQHEAVLWKASAFRLILPLCNPDLSEECGSLVL